MKKLGKIYLYATCIILLAWLLPWLYNLCAPKSYGSPFTLYSCILDDFTSMTTNEKHDLIFKDRKGNLYKGTQFDSVQPMFYNQQLLAEGRMPDSIKGRAITVEAIRTNNFFSNVSPSDLNKTTPRLFMILESLPKRVDLEDAKEAFRSTNDGLEFIDMATNEINVPKSMAFTERMKKKGFKFPIALINGRPTSQKQYDEGYFMTDNEGKLFHLKQTNGKPYVRLVDMDQSVAIENIMITEFPNRETRAYFTDKEHHFYIVDENYKVHLTDVMYNPFEEGFLIVGDMFYYTVKIDNNDEERFYALDAHTYQTVDTMIRKSEVESSLIPEILFPVRLKFTSFDDQWVYPRLLHWSTTALILNIILAGIFAVLRRKEMRKYSIHTLFVVLLGLYAFIPFILIKE